VQGGFFTAFLSNAINPNYSSYHDFQILFEFPPRLSIPIWGNWFSQTGAIAGAGLGMWSLLFAFPLS
jgi:hypothetical protein